MNAFKWGLTVGVIINVVSLKVMHDANKQVSYEQEKQKLNKKK